MISGRSPILLLHGAWLGGWAWLNVAPWLLAHGHSVCAHDLPGLGARQHEEAAGISLHAQIDDVRALMRREGWRDVVLVAHSYAGVIAAALMADAALSIRRVIFLDALLPRPGWRVLDNLPGDAARTAKRTMAGRVLPPDPVRLGAPADDPGLLAFMRARMVPQPLLPLQDLWDGPEDWHTRARAYYLFCTRPRFHGVMDAHAARAAQLGFAVEDYADSHVPMLTGPKTLAGRLLSLVKV